MTTYEQCIDGVASVFCCGRNYITGSDWQRSQHRSRVRMAAMVAVSRLVDGERRQHADYFRVVPGSITHAKYILGEEMCERVTTWTEAAIADCDDPTLLNRPPMLTEVAYAAPLLLRTSLAEVNDWPVMLIPSQQRKVAMIYEAVRFVPLFGSSSEEAYRNFRQAAKTVHKYSVEKEWADGERGLWLGAVEQCVLKIRHGAKMSELLQLWG